MALLREIPLEALGSYSLVARAYAQAMFGNPGLSVDMLIGQVVLVPASVPALTQGQWIPVCLSRASFTLYNSQIAIEVEVTILTASLLSKSRSSFLSFGLLSRVIPPQCTGIGGLDLTLYLSIHSSSRLMQASFILISA
jgi:hypothetical protein